MRNPDRYTEVMVPESDFVGANPPERARSSVPPNLAPGMRIADKYELRRKIGSGAMGEVWAARHVSLEEEVAIKLVLRDVEHDDGSSADSRFLLEARVASQLSRKTRHIVSVTDHGDHGPYAYLVMELLGGESLDARLARTGPMPLAKVVPLIYQVARALAVAHADGIVHRDLKPSNVFVTVDEEGKALLKILDFGIAKLRASLRRMPASTLPEDDPFAENVARGVAIAHGHAKHSTLHGFLLGTPAFMSPEQASGRPIDHRVDVWALAVIAYHLLTGAFPFDGQTAEELFSRLCRVRPIAITTRRQDLPPAIVDLFARAFARHISDRFQSAVAFAAALEFIATAEQRAEGSPPQPMGSISLPPAGEVVRAPSDRPESVRPSAHRPSPAPPPSPAVQETSIVAAGVPRRQKLWPRLLAGGAVLAVLLGTASAVSLYLERDTTRMTGLAAFPTVSTASEVQSSRDEIPPPPDPAPPIVPEKRLVDLPSAPSIAAAPSPRPSSQVVTTAASLPPDPAPTEPPTQQPPSTRLNRSEVF